MDLTDSCNINGTSLCFNNNSICRMS